MTQLDIEIAALRSRRYPRLTVWLRSMPLFDRRSIREPGERDVYWARVQRRLAESDAAWILNMQSADPAPRLLTTGD